MLTAGLNTLWMWQSRGEARRFRRAASQVRIQQQELLRATLSENAGCKYGQEFDFAGIKSLTDYQDRVPICDYNSLQPRFDAITTGRQGILTIEPVLMLEPTGGSSGGGRLIPYTTTLRRQFQRAIAVWMHNVLSDYPGVRSGRAWWSISPVAQRPVQPNTGMRIGFDNDTEYLTGWQRWAMNRLLAVPASVSQLCNIENSQYATLACLLATEDLALISVWSPTFLTTLFARLPEWAAQIVDDLESGCLKWPQPDALDDSRPFPSLKNPCRSRQLRRLLQDYGTSPQFLAECWPRLSLLSAWGDAAAGLFVPAMRHWLPDVPFQPKGLLATEGVVSIPLRERNGSALAIRSHVFEFIPVEEGSDVPQRPRWAWELELGARYRVLLTTGGGLYRYSPGDEVEVMGFLEQCPLLRFIGRSGAESDLVGEKLHEQHVRKAIMLGSGTLGLESSFALLIPLTDPSPGYRALLVCSNWRDAATDHRAVESALAREIERSLYDNSQYQYAVGLGQLRPLEVWLLAATPEQVWSVYEAECRRRGQKSGDIKPTTIARGTGWDGLFASLRFANPSATGGRQV